MSTSAAHPGKPRLDIMDRLRHRFYEPLLLLWMLNPATGPSSQAHPVSTQSPDFLSMWRGFLDSLSYLCDFKHGGATVTAVAAEALPGGTACYWVVSSHREAEDHVQWLLRQLESVDATARDEWPQIVKAIAEKTISLSRDKIKNYARELFRRVDKVVNEIDRRTDGDQDLIEALVELKRFRQDPLDLCLHAHKFDQHHALNRVVDAHVQVRRTSEWSWIRHYLVRLRSWHQKSVQVVRLAGKFPHLLEGHTCRWVQLPENVGLPQSDNKINLRSVLRRMLPADSQVKVNELHDALHSLRDFDFESSFIESYTDQNLSLASHAETVLMEHIYFNGLRLVEGDRYIGCSKGSCYCCSLYFRYHPGNFVLRPSHGTAYAKWSPPLLAQAEHGKAEKSMVFRHVRDVMNQVIGHIRRDVINEIESRLPRRERPPDSTSYVMSVTI